MKKLLNNKLVQLLLALVVGVAIGALFYPTKEIEERVKQEYQEKIDKVSEEKETLRKTMTEQVDSLKEEKTQLTIETSL